MCMFLAFHRERHWSLTTDAATEYFVDEIMIYLMLVLFYVNRRGCMARMATMHEGGFILFSKNLVCPLEPFVVSYNHAATKQKSCLEPQNDPTK